jgi:hypothetical protein
MSRRRRLRFPPPKPQIEVDDAVVVRKARVQRQPGARRAKGLPVAYIKVKRQPRPWRWG